MCHVHKKKSPKHHKKESFKDSLLSKVIKICRVYHHARARQSDQKRLQNLSRETEREKRSRATTKRYVHCFARPKKRKEARSEAERCVF